MIHRLHDPLKKRQPRPLVPNVLALSVALAFAPAAIALPSGELVVSGSVAVGRPDDRNMVVQQGTSKAIVNWQSFSIGGNESVAFRQPGASSAILNRVVGSSPSDIFGRMTANGQVFLVNPSGVFFAPGASVDVGGLVASTLNITDADFLAGRYRFGGGTQGTVSNRGNLQAAKGGTVALLGGQVSNDGTIAAQLGTVALAGGGRVTLDFAGDGLTKITVDEAAVGAQVRNSGMIVADGGQAVLTAYAAQALADTVINQEGLVRARSVGQRNGRILLDGGEEGATLVSGSLDASGTEPGQTGGAVSVLGHHVGVTDQASIDASGSAGGGTVLIGGDYQGSNPAVRNAAATYFGPQASIKADALQSGNGGKVILWSDGPTRAYGTISARGGTGGGDGGLVETSGHWLDVAGARVSAAAPAGVAGNWLLDPGDIEIVSGSEGPIAPIPSSGLFSSEDSGGTAFLLDSDISETLSQGTNVNIRAVGDTFGEGPDGNITVNSGVEIINSNGGMRTLSLIADGSVFMNPSVLIAGNGAGNALGLNLVAQSGIRISGAEIRSNGGDITMFGAGATVGSGGIAIDSSTIDGGTGRISLSGRGPFLGVELGCEGEGCNSAIDTVITTTSPNGTISISGQTTDEEEGGPGIQTLGDVTIGGPLMAGNIVLRASNGGFSDSIVLDSGGSSARIQTTGVINLRPGGVSVAGLLTEAPNEAIEIGSTSSEGSGFFLSLGDLEGIQPGYAALVIGSNQHDGQIAVTAGTTFSGNVTLQNTGSGGSPGGILLNAPLTSAGTVTLASSGDIVQSGINESPSAPITASGLLIHAPNADSDVFLDRSPNLVGTLAVDPPASFSFFNNGPLTIGALTGMGFSADSNAPTSISVTDSSSFGRFFVYAAGNLTLNRSISTLGPNPSSGPSIELVTEGLLTNNAGAGALSPFAGGRWVVWADTFVGETRGGLDPGNAQPNLYGCAYPGSSCVSGVSIPSTGNRFIYEQQPSVTVFADDQLRAFGTANPPLTFTPVGLVNGDAVADALSGTLTTSATQFSPIGLYPITEAIPFTSPVGYIVTFDPGRLGVEGLTPPHHGDDATASFGETYLYERNIGLPPMCLASGPLVPEAGTQGTELLDLEWSRIRLKPNVTNCIAVSEGNTCKSF